MITITTANNETTLENDKAFCAYGNRTQETGLIAEILDEEFLG